jgi:hypothetical protein
MPVQKSAKLSPPAKPADPKPLKPSSRTAVQAQLKVVHSDLPLEPKNATKVAKPVPTKSPAKPEKATAKEETK